MSLASILSEKKCKFLYCFLFHGYFLIVLICFQRRDHFEEYLCSDHISRTVFLTNCGCCQASISLWMDGAGTEFTCSSPLPTWLQSLTSGLFSFCPMRKRMFPIMSPCRLIHPSKSAWKCKKCVRKTCLLHVKSLNSFHKYRLSGT